MADITLSSTINLPTLASFAKRLDPDGKIDKIVELLTQTNDVLKDMAWREGNMVDGHKTTIRTGLPSVTWRKLNYGVQPSRSTTAQVKDTCGMLEAYAQVDKALADLNDNSAAWRLSEDRAFLEAMNQEMATTIFYGDLVANPASFMGLAPRFNKISDDSTKSGYNIIDAGGTAEDADSSTLTSMWFIGWGENTCHGIFPKGSRAGFVHEDLGEVTVEDGNGGIFQAYRSHYRWDCGLTVRDWRSIVRIANIDTSDLDNVDLITLMVRARNRMRYHGNTAYRTVIYCNETIGTALDIQAMNKSNVMLAMREWDGEDVLSFRNCPIRQVDALVNTEAQVE